MERYKRVLHSKGKELASYIFVDDLTLGPALGGLRMKPYKKEEEVLFDGERLAAGMTRKSALAGLSLGGGKAIIVGSQEDKSKQLFHEFGDFVNSLEGDYITAEDVGTSVNDLELVAEVSEYVSGISLGETGSGDPSPFTSYGVYSGMKASVESLESLTVAVQGAGHVGFSLVFGFPEDKKFDKYRELFPGLVGKCKKIVFSDIDTNRINKVKRKAWKNFCCILSYHAHIKNVGSEKIYSVKQDIFSPCALGAEVNDKTIPKLVKSGCKIIAGSANNQLLKPEHGKELQERGILYIPDYAINAGGVINCWFEMDARNNNKTYDVDASIKKCGEIRKTVKEIIERSRTEKKPTYEIADILAKEIIERAKH